MMGANMQVAWRWAQRNRDG